MFRGDPARRGAALHRIPTRQPAVRWSVATEQPIFSSPALSNRGRLFVGSLDGALYSVTVDGELRWKRKLGRRIFASPALTPRGVVVGTDDDAVHMLDAETGEPRWRFDLGPCPREQGFGPDSVQCDADSSVLVAPDDSLLFGGDRLYRLGLDGKQRGRTELPGHAFSSPTMGPDGSVYIGTQGNVALALTAAGTLKWQLPARYHFDSTAALVDEQTVVIGADSGLVYALSTADGAVKWKRRTYRPVRSSPAVDRRTGTVIIGSDSGRVHALDARDGAVRWRFETGGPVRSSPVVDPDGRVVFGSQDNHVYALDDAGALLWRVELGGDVDSSVAVGSRGLYVGCDDGNLYGIR